MWINRLSQQEQALVGLWCGRAQLCPATGEPAPATPLDFPNAGPDPRAARGPAGAAAAAVRLPAARRAGGGRDRRRPAPAGAVRFARGLRHRGRAWRSRAGRGTAPGVGDAGSRTAAAWRVAGLVAMAGRLPACADRRGAGNRPAGGAAAWRAGAGHHRLRLDLERSRPHRPAGDAQRQAEAAGDIAGQRAGRGLARRRGARLARIAAWPA